MSEAALQRVVNYWQTLTPEAARNITTAYTEDAYFRDPFNEVRGADAIRHIFGEMFERLHEPRFVIVETILQGNKATMIWDFTFRMKALKPDMPRKIHGLSVVHFADDGRVNYHRDYWDAAGELYEHFPLIGSLLRWLKRRAA